MSLILIDCETCRGRGFVRPAIVGDDGRCPSCRGLGALVVRAKPETNATSNVAKTDQPIEGTANAEK